MIETTMNQHQLTPKKLGVLVSGNGSNLEALIDAAKQSKMNGHIVVVLANEPCQAIKKAQKAKIPAYVISQSESNNRYIFEQELIEKLKFYQCNFVLLAGFMCLLSRDFVQQFPDRIINIHPSLLPNFKGLHTHQRALQSQVKEHGSTVHLVNANMDDGWIIAQSKLSVSGNETVNRLADKVKALEHRLYPNVIHYLCNDRLRLHNGKAYFDDALLNKPLII